MQATKVSADTQTLLNEENGLWKHAKAHVFKLEATPLAMQPSPWIKGAYIDHEWGQIAQASLRMVHNGHSIAARLEWQVDQPATSTESADEFCDACAVMFPFVKNAPVIMGSEHQWVNMWLWRADDFGPFSVTAAGIGTTQRVRDNMLNVKARYHNGSWRVVFVRDMQPHETRDNVPLKAGMQWQVAVALWQGSYQERAGLKSFSPGWAELDIAS